MQESFVPFVFFFWFFKNFSFNLCFICQEKHLNHLPFLRMVTSNLNNEMEEITDRCHKGYVCTLSPELLKKAEVELKEIPKWRSRDIQTLRNMLHKEKGKKLHKI